MSPTTTLNRDAVSIGDDIEPVGGSVDVETGNEEEESQEEGIPTLEVIQRILRVENDKNPKVADMLFTGVWCVVCVKDGCVEKHLQFERLEKKEQRTNNPNGSF